MKNKIVANLFVDGAKHYEELFGLENSITFPVISRAKHIKDSEPVAAIDLAEILVITSYPPRECGIATYSQDLIASINNKFSSSYTIKVCALESGDTSYSYPAEVKYVLKTSVAAEYEKMAIKVNQDNRIKIVVVQHEFGFYHHQEQAFMQFLYELSKPVILVFHTVLPQPDERLKSKINAIATICSSLVVMTNTSANILINEYGVQQSKIEVIAHGTHLVQHLSENFLKQKYGLTDRKVLTTFGLLSGGKSIETTLEALPAIVKHCPEVVFLIIGKTHPEVVKNEGEIYRESLEQKVVDYKLQDNVIFINQYLALTTLLEYLQLTDIYLFTTNDPNQAVSGTFAYAMSCACPIISTPIPHALEVLTEDTGMIFDFRDSAKLAETVVLLLKNEPLRRSISTNALQKIVSTSWENSAIAHAMLVGRTINPANSIRFNLPAIKLDHMKLMTNETGIIQFSKINQPDITTGYTLDDNARALIATCMYYKLSKDEKCLYYIHKYLSFIRFCQQPGGNFLNYVDENLQFTSQNKECNLEDSNGRAIWALGYLISLVDVLPTKIILDADRILEKSFRIIGNIHSTRAMSFALKGLYYYHATIKSPENIQLIRMFANRLVAMYKHESGENWLWYESYLTYANSIIPEALLCAWLLTGDTNYRNIATTSFNYLLSRIFNANGIEVISNRKWLQKGEVPEQYGEQPIDVAYTLMTLSKFYDALGDESYRVKMETAFNWFLGQNRLKQIVYNPCTGGCYDGLEETNVNLNQGAESTVSYLMARLTIEKYKN